jgi:hypothetical protein
MTHGNRNAQRSCYKNIRSSKYHFLFLKVGFDLDGCENDEPTHALLCKDLFRCLAAVDGSYKITSPCEIH